MKYYVDSAKYKTIWKTSKSYLQAYLCIGQQEYKSGDREQIVEDRYLIKDGVNKIGFDTTENLSQLL